MSKKTSLLWEYYRDEVSDPSFVVCQVEGCKARISMGKTGTERSRLSNTGLSTHLESAHKKEWGEYLTKKPVRPGHRKYRSVSLPCEKIITKPISKDIHTQLPSLGQTLL